MAMTFDQVCGASGKSLKADAFFLCYRQLQRRWRKQHDHVDLLINVTGILHIPGRISPGKVSVFMLKTS